MFRRSLQRQAKWVVGVGLKDSEGATAAIKKAAQLAAKGDTIKAVHIPSVLPQILLTSMSDPGDVNPENTNLFSPDHWEKSSNRAAASALDHLKAEVQDTLTAKDLKFETTVQKWATDAKAGLLKFMREESPDYIVLGPGATYNGSMPAFMARFGFRTTVIIVKDHCKRSDVAGNF